MKNKLKKQMLLSAVMLVAVGLPILYIQLPRKTNSSIGNERKATPESVAEKAAVMREHAAPASQMQHTASEEKDAEEQGTQNAIDAVDNTYGMSAERHSRLLELLSPEKKDVFRGAHVARERTWLMYDESVAKRGAPPPINLPYRSHLEEIYALLESRGYDRDEFDFHYEDFLTKIDESMVYNSTKVMEIKAVADHAEPSLFIQEVETLFEDNTNIGLMLLRYAAYFAQAKSEELLDEAKSIIVALDNYDSKHLDKQALLNVVMLGASNHGYRSAPSGTTEGKLPDRVKIGPIMPFLAVLELDGQL